MIGRSEPLCLNLIPEFHPRIMRISIIIQLAQCQVQYSIAIYGAKME
jgi:hypothetical protein